MGKGKRLRAARAAARRTEAPYPFVIDKRTREKLGPTGLAELALNLWPRDCQTCGWELGELRPTVRLQDHGIHVLASLHHQRCAPAEWTEPAFIQISSARLCSHTFRSFLLTTVRGEHRDDHPMIVINPALEETTLVREHDGTWSAGSIRRHRAMGLKTLDHDPMAKRALPGSSATLDGTRITITLEDTGQSWVVPCDGNVIRQVRAHEGFVLALTTAIDPTHLASLDDLRALGASGRIAAAWVDLDGATPPPQDDKPVPDSLRTFVLYRDPRHTSVGELLDTTDPVLAPAQAHAWAEPLTTGSLIPWTELHDDRAWYTLNALTLDHYILRRHTDAWKLVKVFSRIDGPVDMDEETARAWAAKAVRTKGGHHVLDWMPGPATEPGATALYGSGVPR